MTKHRPTTDRSTPPVVDQIATLLGRDLEVDLTDSATDPLPSVVLDVTDPGGVALLDARTGTDEEDEGLPPLEADLRDPEIFAAVGELVRPLHNKQLDQLMMLVRRQFHATS
ncbi:MAG: hypothetical protein AAFZ07_02055 [Actinomycetota bacterium]